MSAAFSNDLRELISLLQWGCRFVFCWSASMWFLWHFFRCGFLVDQWNFYCRSCKMCLNESRNSFLFRPLRFTYCPQTTICKSTEWDSLSSLILFAEVQDLKLNPLWEDPYLQLRLSSIFQKLVLYCLEQKVFIFHLALGDQLTKDCSMPY